MLFKHYLNKKVYKVNNLKDLMGKKRERTSWGAYDISLEKAIKEVVEKLHLIGIPNPTKIEASALIAYRQQNNVNFMTEKQIKEFIMRHRGFNFI